jgi:hypothetical protein
MVKKQLDSILIQKILKVILSFFSAVSHIGSGGIKFFPSRSRARPGFGPVGIGTVPPDPSHISGKLEMRPHLSREMWRLLLEMWMWVRWMRISKGDDTSPVGNDRISWRRCRGRCGISCGRFARIFKFRDMWHYSNNFIFSFL